MHNRRLYPSSNWYESVTWLAGYVTVTLMTFDMQSNGRRIEVEM